ncbi:MAG: oxidoreductase [Anaerolineaceae bacterium]|nr:oxidoreductase [Anaerolineaceae bacterium]
MDQISDSLKKNIAVIGCGYWGVNYIRLFSQLAQVNLVAICDTQTDRLNSVGEKFPLLRKYNEVQRLLKEESLDAVIIATNPETHFDVTKEVINAGVHVLVEKPMTLISAESKELIDLAKQKNLILMVGHTFMFNAGIKKVKDILKSNEVGDVYYLYATRTNMGPIRTDVNSLWDLAPHDISIFSYLLGENPIEVNAIGKVILNHEREDVGFITLKYPSGVIGNIHVSWIDPYKVRQVVVVGSQMRIMFDDMSNLEPVRIFHKGVEVSHHEQIGFGEFKLLIRDGDIVVPKLNPSEPLKNQALHFLQCIDENKEPISDGMNGFYVVRIMEAIQESIHKNGLSVQINYE